MYGQTAISDNYITSPARTDLSGRLLDEMKDLYYGHFYNFWFLSLLEQNAFDSSRLRYIHNMLDVQSDYHPDSIVFSEGIEAIDELILTSKRYLLPALRDKLGISGFSRNSRNTKEDLVMRNMFCYTFPYNLQRLEELVTELKKAVK